jgi:predicted nucleic acid-binding protein
VILVDASVAAKWLLPEPGSEAAIDLISGPDLLFAPALIRIEVLAAITRSTRMGEASGRESLARCEKWLHYLDDGAVSLVPDTALLADAVDLALSLKHPLQDCLYLAAAKNMKGRLVTADPTFAKRAKANYEHVEMLAGCESH